MFDLINILFIWKCYSFSCFWLFVTQWTEACQAPLSMEFSRQECSSGLPFPSKGGVPDPRIEPRFPTLRQIFYHLSHQGNQIKHIVTLWAKAVSHTCIISLLANFTKLFLGENVGANEAYFIIDLWLVVDWLLNLISDLTKYNT